ncbi:uncharacterized protein LOC110063002 [Orbicella faveolata]|uniref:uncharacterized protein LOC110063002 n=1 Tax=Orbicella faveolata TaxID=48498 RepID=UPI0009E22C63|nr:uncharacterized protein LOC110063002 [Orbicella faveolata]
MASEASDEDRKSPRVHNACYYPELTTFGPEIIQEIRRLNCSITVQMDPDRIPPYYYWIVGGMQNALDVLESGDWITSINGTIRSFAVDFYRVIVGEGAEYARVNYHAMEIDGE